MHITREIRLPGGGTIKWLRRDILDAALGRAKLPDPDYVTLYKSREQAHSDAVRAKLDRISNHLSWIRFLLATLMLSYALHLVGK